MLSVRDRISHGRAGNAIVFASPDVFLKPSEGVLRFSRPDFISSSVCACMRDAGKKGEGGGATSRKSNGRGTEVSESGRRRAIGVDAQLEIQQEGEMESRASHAYVLHFLFNCCSKQEEDFTESFRYAWQKITVLKRQLHKLQR